MASAAKTSKGNRKRESGGTTPDIPLKRDRNITVLAKELAGIFLSVFLFYLAFPNDISDRGFGFLGFVALLPLIWTVNRTPFWRVLIYGLFAGFATYALFNVWLINFHPLAIFIVPVIYAVYYTILLPLLKLPRYVMGRYAWIGQVLIWLAYEYLRTRGFLGYAYGIIGYTQYLNIPLLNFATFTGVWGVSAVVSAPQFFIAGLLSGRPAAAQHKHAKDEAVESGEAKIPLLSTLLARLKTTVAGIWGGYRVEVIVLAAILVLAPVMGALSYIDYSDAPTKKLALVQQNVDPWIGGLKAYRDSMEASIRQSKLALAEAPDVDMVVWSETSFIPAIEFHTRYRTEPEKYELVDELLSYIDSAGVPFLLGNGDGQLFLNDDGQYVRHDYNAVYLYRGRDDHQIYRKLHLVPFTEHFPYEKQFPWLYQALVDNDTSFWYEGDEWTVFSIDGLKFSTPICFEDTFGYLSRGFVRRGAELIINLTNDSWSKSVPAATQHMAMAVFRAVENRRSVVRSTNGGMTAVIDPNGRIIATNTPFTESYIISDVPVYTASTGVYTVIGNLFAYLFLTGGIISVILSLTLLVIRRFRKPG